MTFFGTVAERRVRVNESASEFSGREQEIIKEDFKLTLDDLIVLQNIRGPRTKDGVAKSVLRMPFRFPRIVFRDERWEIYIFKLILFTKTII